MHALLHPALELVGIVSGYRDVSQNVALRNSMYVLKLARREDIPLINEAKSPLSGLPPEYFTNTQSHTVWVGLIPGILMSLMSILKPIMDYYSEQYKDIIPGINGIPLHDVTLFSYLTNKAPYELTER